MNPLKSDVPEAAKKDNEKDKEEVECEDCSTKFLMIAALARALENMKKEMDEQRKKLEEKEWSSKETYMKQLNDLRNADERVHSAEMKMADYFVMSRDLTDKRKECEELKKQLSEKKDVGENALSPIMNHIDNLFGAMEQEMKKKSESDQFYFLSIGTFLIGCFITTVLIGVEVLNVTHGGKTCENPSTA